MEKPSSPKWKNARVSNHHPNIQHYTDDGRQPWLTDNVSIEFIVPRSKEDKKRYRARVEQNASGTIQPFDVTTYQYDSTLIDPTDITTIFKAIIVFLNGGGYTDPFIGTPKQAKVLPRHSNIKPHKGSASSTPLTCSRNIGIDDNYLNEMTIYCLGDIIPLNENKQHNKNRNMKQTIKLRESELKRMIAESVKRAINEAWDIDVNGVIDYDEFGRAKNRSYADVSGLSRGLASDTKELLRHTPHRDIRAETNYQYRLDEPNGREFSDDSGKWLRPSDWFVRGADGWNDDEFNDYDKQIGNNHGTNTSAADRRWKKAADSRPLHRKGSLNRAMDETINRIVSESIRRNFR